MKRFVLIIAALAAFALSSYAQLTAADSRGISIQGIARDNSGSIYASQNISLTITVLNGSNPIYVEIQSGLSTDIAGVFSTNIGIAPTGGTLKVTTGTTFSAVDFNVGSLSVQVQVQVGTGSLVTVGTFALQSVPYAKLASLATNAIHAANADNATHASDGVPPGTIMAFGGTVCPAGWVFCDGTIYDGANNNYSALYNVIGTIWGNGTIIGLGTTNATGGTKPFNVPDLRGMFLRGVDGTRGDLPDENNRVRIYAGSFSGNNIGTYESDQYASHSHTTSVSKDGSHQHNIALTRVSVSSGGSYGDTPVGLPDGNPTDAVTANDGAHTHTITIGNAGGAETRPRNMAVLYIIKL